MSQTSLAKVGKLAWHLLEEYGQDPESLFLEAGIDPKLIDSPGARVDIESANKLWSRTSDLIDDPCFGLRAVKHWHPSHFGALGYAWLTSSSLRTAFNRFDRYVHTVSEFVDFQLEDTDKGFVVTLIPKPTMQDIPARIDAMLAIFIMMCRINVDEELNPSLVTFTHKEFPCVGEYYAFFRSPVQFEAATNSFTLPAEVIDQQ